MRRALAATHPGPSLQAGRLRDHHNGNRNMRTIKTRLFAYEAERPEAVPSDRKPVQFTWTRDPLFTPGWHEIELDTGRVFGNQWNTACGKRVFDWCEIVYSYDCLAYGHFLEVTEEMLQVRKETLTCGYCQKHYRPGDGQERLLDRFCSKCISSQYLKAKDLPLLLLVSAGESFGFDRGEHVSAEEIEELEKVYDPVQKAARTIREEKRIEAKRAKIEKDLENAKVEHAGMLWLIDLGIDTENVIYHGHSDEFHFGWHSKLSDEEVSQLLDQLGAEFPFRYRIKGISKELQG